MKKKIEELPSHWSERDKEMVKKSIQREKIEKDLERAFAKLEKKGR